MRTLQVERRSRYGRPAYIPVNAAAKTLAEIAGTVEVRTKDIVLAAQLGFTVIRVERLSDGKTCVDVETLAVPT